MAFAAINRTQPWTVLYKTGLPLEMVTHTRGRKQSKSPPKRNGEYGQSERNDVGALQGSAIGAPRCIIYLDDLAQDYYALNYHGGIIAEISTRLTNQRGPHGGVNNY